LTKQRLTTKQQTVLDFIQRYLAEHRMSPLIREIQFGCQIASYKSVIDRLNALERKHFILREPNKHRSIRVSRKTHELLAKAQVESAQASLTAEQVGA